MATELTARQAAAVARLVTLRPVETDTALQSLATSQGVGFKIGLRYPEGRLSVVSSVEVRGCGDVARVIEGYRAAMTPAPAEDIENWIAELSVIAPRRASDGLTIALLVRAYSERLRAYPADVARDAMLGRPWKFFPSWAELHGACEDLVSYRRMTLSALERAAEKPEEPARDIGTAEERAAAAARIMADVFGAKSMGDE